MNGGAIFVAAALVIALGAVVMLIIVTRGMKDE